MRKRVRSPAHSLKVLARQRERRRRQDVGDEALLAAGGGRTARRRATSARGRARVGRTARGRRCRCRPAAAWRGRRGRRRRGAAPRAPGAASAGGSGACASAEVASTSRTSRWACSPPYDRGPELVGEEPQGSVVARRSRSRRAYTRDRRDARRGWDCGVRAAVAFRPLPAIPAAPRAVAQLGSALDWGSSGRRFKSCQPDQS